MRVLKKIFFAALLLVLVGLLAAFAYYFTVTAGAKLESDKLAISESFAEVFDAENEKTAEISFLGADKKVRLSEVPESVRFAFIAAEDNRFYDHIGIDPIGIGRAIVTNITSGGIAQGVGLALSEDYEDIKKHSTMAGAGIPYIKDIPDNIELIYVETPRPDGPFGASGTGEIPLCGPHPAIINAIYNACGARVTHLPAYPEKVLAAMKK